QLVLEGAALLAPPLGPVVQHETAVRREYPMDLPGDLQEGAAVPVHPVPLPVAVLRLPVVRRRGDHQIDAVVRQFAQRVQAVADVQPTRRGGGGERQRQAVRQSHGAYYPGWTRRPPADELAARPAAAWSRWSPVNRAAVRYRPGAAGRTGR